MSAARPAKTVAPFSGRSPLRLEPAGRAGQDMQTEGGIKARGAMPQRMPGP